MSLTLDHLVPVIPKSAQLIIEDKRDLVLCKPHLIPLKSFTLEKLEKMQQEAHNMKDKLPNSSDAK